MFKLKMVLLVIMLFVVSGCTKDQDSKDRLNAQNQQSQYAKSQPVPVYDWSLERHLIIEMYNVRNIKAATHSVWRSSTGIIEGDCSSIGFGLPYDTSLTNPLQPVSTYSASPIVEQAEPNGIFASKNTSATWVMCSGEHGNIDPVYVETTVSVYPYPVNVDYDANRVTKSGKSSVSISVVQPVNY